MTHPHIHLASLGLGGDGDEVEAILNVEREFDIKFNYDDAPRWISVGNVFESLKAVVPAELLSTHDLWDRFAKAIAHESGAEPSQVGPETLLLIPNAKFRRRAVVAVCIAIGAGIALYKHWF